MIRERHIAGAGSGNRTRLASLEGWNFTDKLYPHLRRPCQSRARIAKRFFQNLRWRPWASEKSSVRFRFAGVDKLARPLFP